MPNGASSENRSYDKECYAAYANEPCEFDYLEVMTERWTRRVIVKWGTNQADFFKNKDVSGYRSHLFKGASEDAVVTQHATLDAMNPMIEHA
jgi:hypothetical protein